MAEKDPQLPVTIIPWWQDGNTISSKPKEPYFLSKGIYQFFKLLKSWLLFPINQIDALTCSESLLDIMAWDKDIKRFNDEPIELYRKRIKYAHINAKEAGSVAGFKAIFERLGVGYVDIDERIAGRDWDVISIRLNDSQLSSNYDLLAEIIKHYGRTCRRYEYQVITPIVVQLTASAIDWEQQCSVAVLED